MTAPQRTRWTCCLGILGAATLLAACTPTSGSGLAREQRKQARRLADTRADVDALRGEVARLRGQMQRAGYASPAVSGSSRPANPRWSGGDTTGGAPPDRWGAPAEGAADGRWPSGGTAMPPRQDESAWGTAATADRVGATSPGASPLGIELRGDLARGPDAEEYRAGLEAFQRGAFPQCIQSLRNFVSRNRGSDLAPFAHFWIGEAYFAQGKYYDAILSYNEIPTSWPDHERVPASKLRQAEAFAASGDVMDARLYLKEIIDNYPGTPEAVEAKRRLRTL